MKSPNWNREELTYLENKWFDHTPEQIATKLTRRTPGAITKKAYQLNLKRRPVRTFEDKELMFLLYYQEGLTLETIAEKFEIDASTVWKHIRELKVKRATTLTDDQTNNIVAEITATLITVQKSHRLTAQQMIEITRRVSNEIYNRRINPRV